MSLIRAYGEYWNGDAVARGTHQNRRTKTLMGKAKVGRKKKRWIEVNVWDQRGIYVLLADYKVVYVGKTEDRALGSRLRQHSRDRFAARWDMFSWYGVKVIAADGHLRDFEGRGVSQGDIIRTLESLAIATIDPPLNRRRDRLPGALKVEQEFDEGPTVEERLDELILIVKGENSSRGDRRGRTRAGRRESGA